MTEVRSVVVKLRTSAASAATANPMIAIQAVGLNACVVRSQHCLYFFPLPHGQGSFRPTLPARATVTTSSKPAALFSLTQPCP